jgi:hypothetical protein
MSLSISNASLDAAGACATYDNAFVHERKLPAKRGSHANVRANQKTSIEFKVRNGSPAILWT